MGRGQAGYQRRWKLQTSRSGGLNMPKLVKLGLVVLATILAVLLVFLVMGIVIGGPGTDSNNSDVNTNTSQDQ